MNNGIDVTSLCSSACDVRSALDIRFCIVLLIVTVGHGHRPGAGV